MFLWCVPDCDAHLLSDLNCISTSIAQLYEFSEGTDSFALTDAQYTSLATEILDVFIQCQAEILVYDLQHLISSCSLKDEPYTSKETMEFLDSVHVTINDLLNRFPTERSLKSLGEIVLLLRDLVYYTPLADSDNYDQGLNVHVWANTTACMLLLYWLSGTGERRITSLFLYLQIIDPWNPIFIKECFEYIKVPTMKCADRILFGEFVSRFVDFFLENLILILNDDVHMVREGLIFIITFLADPPDNTINDSDDLMPFVRERIYAVLDQASDNLCFYSQINMDLARGKTMLDDFLKSIDEVRGDIVNLYVHMPPSLGSNFPRIDRFGYFESLLAYLENLKETMNNNKKLVPFLKHQVFTIHGELFPLRFFLQDASAMQNEHDGSKDILEQIMSLSYRVDFAIKSSFFNDYTVWHNLARLSFFILKIKDIRYKVIEFETQTERTASILPLMSSIDVPKPPTYSSNAEVVVGFKQEIQGLIDRLEWGRLSNVRKFSCICHGWWDQERECNQLPKLEILTKLETLCMSLFREAHLPFMYSFPTTIRKLTLVSNNIPWNDLSVIIGMLPCLEVLVLHKILVGGKRWDVEEDEFPSIKSLTLKDVDIEEWNASIDSFPSLEILTVLLCYSLVEIPPCFSDTVTLKCIKVYYCEKSVADSAIQIQKDQVDSGNESFEVVLAGIKS